MMKKLGMIVFVMALVVAFALPAFAFTVEGAKGERFTIGGTFMYDIGYRLTNKNYNTKTGSFYGSDDRTNFFSDLSQSSYVMGNYANGPFSATFILSTQSSYESYHKQVYDYNANSPYSVAGGSINSYLNTKDNAIFDLVYGTYSFGSMSISAGKMSPITVVQAPSSVIGYSYGEGGTIVGIAYGFVYENKKTGIRLQHNINKMIHYVIGLNTTGTLPEDVDTGAGISLRESYATLPNISARVGFNFGHVVVMPGFSWEQVKWNNLPTGWDDKVDVWFVRLPVQLRFGAFTALIEGLYGQNLGGLGSSFATLVASESSYSGYWRDAGGTIHNGNTLNGWVDLSYTFGPVTPHFFYGQTRSGNDDRYKTGDKDGTRSYYGVNA